MVQKKFFAVILSVLFMFIQSASAGCSGGDDYSDCVVDDNSNLDSDGQGSLEKTTFAGTSSGQIACVQAGDQLIKMDYNAAKSLSQGNKKVYILGMEDACD